MGFTAVQFQPKKLHSINVDDVGKRQIEVRSCKDQAHTIENVQDNDYDSRPSHQSLLERKEGHISIRDQHLMKRPHQQTMPKGGLDVAILVSHAGKRAIDYRSRGPRLADDKARRASQQNQLSLSMLDRDVRGER